MVSAWKRAGQHCLVTSAHRSLAFMTTPMSRGGMGVWVMEVGQHPSLGASRDENLFFPPPSTDTPAAGALAGESKSRRIGPQIPSL